jgi:hypothetical protein
MSNQLQITGDLKVKTLTGALTATSGVVTSVALGGANGVATLDSGGKIPVTQLPNSVMEYKGSWDASTNTPTLADGTGNAGDVYICSVAGTVNFGSGPITFAVNDQVIYNGTIWQKIGGGAGSITGSGTSGEIAYFNGPSTITSEAAFVYDASTNRLGVNTSVPNATIGANNAIDSGYGLLIKSGSSNYNGIGLATDSTYGNLISTEKLGTALARNLTLLNQSGFVSLKENGNFGVNTLNPAVSGTGVDIYGSGNVGLRFHTGTSGTTVSDGAGINFTTANNLGIANYENGAIDLVSNGYSGVYISNIGYVGINGATPTVALTVTGAGSFTSNVTATNFIIPAAGRLQYSATSYITPEDNIQGARIKTLGGFIVESASSTFSSSITTTQLNAYGASNSNVIIAGVNSGTNNPRVFIQADESTNTVKILAGSSTGSDNMAFGVGGSTSNLYIKAGGNVGIGTTSPLAFTGFTALTIASSATNNQCAIFLANSNTTIRGSWYNNSGVAINFGTATAHPLIFDTTDIERMRITSGGSVLVGTIFDSGQKLQVNGITQTAGLSLSGTTVSTSQTITSSFYMWIFSGAAGQTLTLYSSTGHNNTHFIKNSSANILTLSAASIETLTSTTVVGSITIDPYKTVQVISNGGSVWIIMSQF